MAAPIRHIYHDGDALCRPPRERKLPKINDALDDQWIDDHEEELSTLVAPAKDVWDKGQRKFSNKKPKRSVPTVQVRQDSVEDVLQKAWKCRKA